MRMPGGLAGCMYIPAPLCLDTAIRRFDALLKEHHHGLEDISEHLDRALP